MTSLGSTVTPASAAMHAASAASIFFSIIDAPQPQTSGLEGPQVSSQEDIVFENVNFTYPLRADVKVLDNLSLRFPAGKMTAIVGASGSGKSTIVGLIERWYELDGNMTDKIMVIHLLLHVFSPNQTSRRYIFETVPLKPETSICRKLISSGGDPRSVWYSKSHSSSMTRFIRMLSMA